MASLGHQECTEFRCVACNKAFDEEEIVVKGYCPLCNRLLVIKAKIKDTYYATQWIKPEMLKVNMQYNMLNQEIYSILDVRKVDDKYRLALKGYKVIKIKAEDLVSIAIGDWSYE